MTARPERRALPKQQHKNATRNFVESASFRHTEARHHPAGGRGSSRRCQSAETTCPRIDIRGYTGKCHPAFISGAGLALPPDLDRADSSLDFAFHRQRLAARRLTNRHRKIRAVTRNDHDLERPAKDSGGVVDRPFRAARYGAADNFSTKTTHSKRGNFDGMRTI